MHVISSLALRKWTFFAFFLLALAVAVLLFCSMGKVNSFMVLNPVHTRLLDIIFMCVTFLGDGWFSLAVGLLLFLLRFRRLSLHVVVVYLVSGLAAQLLKRIFVSPRPREVINEHVYTFFLKGISGTGWDSFPSGHTTSAFALATILAMHINKKSWGILFLFIAILVGYSRIYLGQHFLQDVAAGSVLGTVTGLLVYICMQPRENTFNTGNSSRLAGH